MLTPVLGKGKASMIEIEEGTDPDLRWALCPYASLAPHAAFPLYRLNETKKKFAPRNYRRHAALEMIDDAKKHPDLIFPT